MLPPKSKKQLSRRPKNEAERHRNFPHYHNFVSHAGEQKQELAYPIYETLVQVHPSMSVFVDERSLKVGDNAPMHMDTGVETCDTAVVVLSQEYIRKKYPMRELHILLQRLHGGEADGIEPAGGGEADITASASGGEAGGEAPGDSKVENNDAPLDVLLVLHDSINCLEELADMEEQYKRDDFWRYNGRDYAPLDEATYKRCAQDLRRLGGCSVIHRDEWADPQELAAMVEMWVADRLHARRELPARMERFSTIMPPPALWGGEDEAGNGWGAGDVVVRREEAQQAEDALLRHRYVELRGGPGEGKTSLAQQLAERLWSRWHRWPPAGTVGKRWYALEVDLRGMDDVASLKHEVARQVLTAADPHVLQQGPLGLSDSSLHAQQPAAGEKLWLEFMSWVLRQAPCPLLLLLENAEDAMHHQELPEVLARLRALPHVHLIVASRAHDMPSQAADTAEACVVDLYALGTDEGLQVVEAHLYRRLREEEQEAARKLVDAVQANPLFCGVAACLVKQTGRTWQVLLDLCEEDMELVRPADGRAGGMKRRLTLLQRWLRSILEPQEQLFLAHIAVFAGSFTETGAAAMQLPLEAVADQQEQVAIELVEEPGSSLTDAGAAAKQLHGDNLADMKEQVQHPQDVQLLGGQPGGWAGGSSTGIEESLQRLQLLSLIRQQAAGNDEPASYSMGSRWRMHALVQQAASKLLGDGGDSGSCQQAAAEHMHERGSSQPAMEVAARRLNARFAQWMLRHPEGPGQALVQCDPVGGKQPDAPLLWYLLAAEQANLQAAAKKLPLTDLQADCWQGESGSNQAYAMDRVGDTLTSTGQYKVALQLRMCLVEIMTVNHGATDYNTLNLQGNAAVTLLEMGRLAEAQRLQEEVLDAMTLLLGPDHPDTLSVKSNLAGTLQEMGQPEQAQQLQEEVLAARTLLLGPDHPSTLSVKINLAGTLQQTGQLAEARQRQTEVLAARTQRLGPDHPRTISAKSKLATTLQEMGQWLEARQLQEEAVAAMNQLVGPHHPDNLVIKSNLANTLQEMGLLMEARQLQEELLAARTRLQGHDHPDTLGLKSNMANNLLEMGQLAEARQLQEEVLAAMS